MTFRQFLNEKKVEIFHGDNYKTKSIQIDRMNSGNNQEGIGVYFANRIEVAKSYGKDVVKTTIEDKKFIDSRMDIGDAIGVDKIYKILKDMFESDTETFYYMITDWVEISEPEDIEDYHIEDLASNISTDQVRNFQVDLADKFGVEEFVKSWNKHTKIDGTFQRQTKEDVWYAVINPKIKLESL